MKRWMKILLAIVGLFVLGLASIPLFVNANTFRPTIEAQLTSALGRSVKLGDLRLSIFSASLVAKDLSVADDPSFSAAPFLTAKEVRIGVFLRPLIFSRKVDVRSFQITSPQITLIRATNGTWNFSSIGRIPDDNFAGGDSKLIDVSPGEFPVLDVRTFVIEGGRVVVASAPAHDQPRVYENVDLSVSDLSFDSQFPFDLSADLPGGGTVQANGHVGPLNRMDAATTPADVQVSIKRLDPVAAGFVAQDAGVSFLADLEMRSASDGHTLTTKGTMHIQNLRLRKGGAVAPGPIDFSYSGTHRLKENSGQIEDATTRVGGAQVHVSGTYQPVVIGPVAIATDERELNLKLTGQSLPIDELQHFLTVAGVRLPHGAVLKGGTLGLDLAIIGPAKSLVTSGPIALDHTHLVGFDIGSKIHGIAALSGLKTGDTTAIEKLRANVRITNAGVVVDEIDAVVPAVGEIRGNGTVSSDNKLDFNLVAKINSAQGIGKAGVGLLTKLNGPGDTSNKMSGVPLRVVGTPEDPYITADVGGIIQKKKNSLATLLQRKK